MKLKNYQQGYHMVSLALDSVASEQLATRNLDWITIDQGSILLQPSNITLSTDPSDLEKLQTYHNYDVFEIWEDGTFICRYDDSATDNLFFMTGSCNSNCIMCPSPDISRKNAFETDMVSLQLLAQHIPSDTPHLTITGGEPFLVGEPIFPFLAFLRDKFLQTEFLFLTNGRIFAVDSYVEAFVQCRPAHSTVAIPLHGANSQLHDAITRAPNSFRQTVLGIQKLLHGQVPVELRVVVQKMNIDHFDEIANYILTHFQGIAYVSIIAMEMTGNAHVNRETVWVSYREAFEKIASSIHALIAGGIDVRLYNFPFCTVAPAYWTLCEQSISPQKVKFGPTCNQCTYQSTCSGIFAGTYQLEKDELMPI